MKNYIVYTTATGVIVRTGQCRNDLFKLQAASGQSVLEGSAASDGSKKIVDGAIVDTPGWTPPAAPASPEIVDLTEVNATLDDHEIRLDRIENPYPDSIDITFSDIGACGEDDDSSTPIISAMNTTFTLNKTSGVSYQLIQDDLQIDVILAIGGSGGQVAFMINSRFGFEFFGDVFRGYTVENSRQLISSCSTYYETEGYGGTCFIN